MAPLPILEVRTPKSARYLGKSTHRGRAKTEWHPVLSVHTKKSSRGRLDSTDLIDPFTVSLRDARPADKLRKLRKRELAAARAALAAEDEKSKARKRLEQAMAERAIGPLKSALAAAERAQLKAEELLPAKELLKELEEKAG